MKALLRELVAETERLEELVANRVPRDGAYAMQWSLNRLVKKKVASVVAVSEQVATKCLRALGATSDDHVDALQNLQRKVDFALKLARHSGVGVSFSSSGGGGKKKGTLFSRLVDGRLVDGRPPVTSARREKKFVRKGVNFCWLFQPKFAAEAHKLVAVDGIKYSPRLIELEARYVCKGLKYSQCVEYIRFAREWFSEADSSLCESPYAMEMRAIERVWAGEEDPWGYAITPAVQRTLLSRIAPPAFEKLDRRASAAQRPAVLVADSEALRSFVAALLQLPPIYDGLIPTIAVDVEFCAAASYRGCVGLIQISTVEDDYIVDPFAIPAEELHRLNEVFANPGILKVMHGIEHDVVWLQTEFSLFLVNVFDTFVAAKTLRVPSGYSLYSLVLQYCSIALDKTQQCSDWRIRPLTVAQIQYAREDTRYLIHVASAMRNQILALTNQHEPWSLPTSADQANKPSTAFGRKLLLQVMSASQQCAARIASWSPPNFEAKLDRLHQSVAGCNAPITNGVRLCAEVAFAWRDLRARDQNVPATSICADAELYKWVHASVASPQAPRRPAGGGMAAEDSAALASLIAETYEKIEKPAEVYLGAELRRKRPRAQTMPVAASDGAARAPSSSKRTKLLNTEIDRLKSERADDGALEAALTEEPSDAEIVLTGYYQAGCNQLACFEKRGAHTRKNVLALDDRPPWLCVWDGASLVAAALP